MRWLVDGYNVIRRAPELKSREQESLEAGREALCALLVQVARASADTFTVVFDGAQAGGRGGGGSGVTVIFSSAALPTSRSLETTAPLLSPPNSSLRASTGPASSRSKPRLT